MMDYALIFYYDDMAVMYVLLYANYSQSIIVIRISGVRIYCITAASSPVHLPLFYIILSAEDKSSIYSWY